METKTTVSRYLHYHPLADTPETLAYPELARLATGLYGAPVAIANQWAVCQAG